MKQHEANILQCLEQQGGEAEEDILLDEYRETFGKMSAGALSFACNNLHRDGHLIKTQFSRNATGVRQVDFRACEVDEQGLRRVYKLTGKTK